MVTFITGRAQMLFALLISIICHFKPEFSYSRVLNVVFT